MVLITKCTISSHSPAVKQRQPDVEGQLSVGQLSVGQLSVGQLFVIHSSY